MTGKTEIVLYDKTMRAIGRNGLYAQAGITVEPRHIGLGGGTYVEIRGLTSRNKQATGKLAVPTENIDAIIEALQKAKKELET